MKIKLCFLFVFLAILNSCATTDRKILNCHERCSQKGMICVGITESDSDTSSWVTGTSTSIISSKSGESISCRPARTESEKEAVSKFKKQAGATKANKTSENTKLMWGTLGAIFTVVGLFALII